MKYLVFSILIMASCSMVRAQQVAGDEGNVHYPVFLNIYEDLGIAQAYQSKDDPNGWYILPNRATIQRTRDGRLQFGFIRYVKNTRSGAYEDERDRGEGGGVVWFTVGFRISEEERDELLQELRRRQGRNARIMGSLAFDSGIAELITFGRAPNGESTTQVIGTGSAPLMEGDAVAVNIMLNEENATLLWATLNGDSRSTANLSINFSMSLRGYHTPVNARITMDTDKILKNERIAAGVNAGMSTGNINAIMGAEIDKITNDLISSGAIVIEQTGDIGSDGEEIKKSAIDAFMAAFLTPIDMKDLLNQTNEMRKGDSPLEKATKLRNEQLNQSVQYREREALRAQQTSAPPLNIQPTPPNQQVIDLPGGQEGASSSSTQAAAETPLRMPEELQNRGASETAGTSSSQPNSSSTPNTTQPNSQNQTNQSSGSRPGSNLAVGINAYMGYSVSNITQRQKYSVELSKIREVIRDRNITTELPRIPDYLLFQVNLDDPLYRQREIVAMIDGFNARDFGQFINYANIIMRKRHAGGDITTDEVRVDRNNFSREGNHFKLLYGWQPGDHDRSNWLNYEYKVNWSFFGGAELEQGWTPTDRGAINISPPYNKHTINIIGEAEELRDAQVRTATVRVYFIVNGQEISRMRSFNVSRGEFESNIEVLLAPDFQYEYEITWQLRGNRLVESGRLRANTATIFFDELPLN